MPGTGVQGGLRGLGPQGTQPGHLQGAKGPTLRRHPQMAQPPPGSAAPLPHHPIVRQPARESWLTSHPPTALGVPDSGALRTPWGTQMQQADSDAAGVEQGPGHSATDHLTGGAAGTSPRSTLGTARTRPLLPNPRCSPTPAAPAPEPACDSFKGGPRFHSPHQPGPCQPWVCEEEGGLLSPHLTHAATLGSQCAPPELPRLVRDAAGPPRQGPQYPKPHGLPASGGI